MSNTLREILVNNNKKKIKIYFTSNPYSVVVEDNGSVYVFESSSIIDMGDAATYRNLSSMELFSEIIPNALKCVTLSGESRTARIRIIQLLVGQVQNIRNSCSIKNGKSK